MASYIIYIVSSALGSLSFIYIIPFTTAILFIWSTLITSLCTGWRRWFLTMIWSSINFLQNQEKTDHERRILKSKRHMSSSCEVIEVCSSLLQSPAPNARTSSTNFGIFLVFYSNIVQSFRCNFRQKFLCRLDIIGYYLANTVVPNEIRETMQPVRKRNQNNFLYLCIPEVSKIFDSSKAFVMKWPGSCWFDLLYHDRIREKTDWKGGGHCLKRSLTAVLYQTMWSRCCDVVVEGHIIEMGNRGRAGKGKGEEGGQYTSNLGPEWMGIASHAKEGFQVIKRDSGTGEGFSRQRGIIKGDRQGVIKGDCAMCSNIMSTLYILC